MEPAGIAVALTGGATVIWGALTYAKAEEPWNRDWVAEFRKAGRRYMRIGSAITAVGVAIAFIP